MLFGFYDERERVCLWITNQIVSPPNKIFGGFEAISKGQSDLRNHVCTSL